MIFLGNLTQITATKYKVGLQHDAPFDPIDGMNMPQSQLETIGILVDAIPDPQPPTGQVVLGTFVDPTTKMVTYEYTTPSATPEQQIAELQAQNEQLKKDIQATQDAVDFLLMGGM